VNREEFMKALGARNAEREEVRAAESLFRAMKVQRTHVANMHEVFVPAVAWIATIVALSWMWRALDAHRLVGIAAAHLLFRFFVRGYMNIVWVPRLFRRLADRFPQFRSEIEAAAKEVESD
jgi:hypothetical protein